MNHNLLISKIKDLTKDNTLARTINTLLRNRRYCVELEGKVSRWRIQKNGLPQGSVLAPTLFNIYTNDQPILTQAGVKHFIYADDTALAVQGDTFQDVESTLEESLRVLSDYYDENFLKPNPSKTQVCAFHLKNREADRTLEIEWRDTKLNNSAHPTYLGVMLDRSLTYKHHCEKTKLKIATRNNILRKLTGSTWGANAHTLRVSALSLCFSAGEYASPVWSRSAHTKQIDTILNESCRLVTGCLKSTPLPKIYQLAGIAPPNIRREVAADWERTKAETDIRHPLHNQTTPNFRLKSRKSFLKTTKLLHKHPEEVRRERWKLSLSKENNKLESEPAELLPAGYELDWPTWRSLNRLRVGVGRAKNNLKKWGMLQDISTKCECGMEQNMEHLLNCQSCPFSCTKEDLLYANPNAIGVARFWSRVI